MGNQRKGSVGATNESERCRKEEVLSVGGREERKAWDQALGKPSLCREWVEENDLERKMQKGKSEKREENQTDVLFHKPGEENLPRRE